LADEGFHRQGLKDGQGHATTSRLRSMPKKSGLKPVPGYGTLDKGEISFGTWMMRIVSEKEEQHMRLAIGTTFNYDIPFEAMLPLVKNSGFDTISVGGRRDHSGYHTESGRKTIEKLTTKHKITIDSIHAPLRLDGDISSSDERLRLSGIEAVDNGLDACYDLGVSILILHLNKEFSEEELEHRIESVLRSLPDISDYARERGIRLAIENIPEDPSNAILQQTLETFPQDHVGVCYDSSHANLTQAPLEILDRYGRRVIALHISDNKGKLDDHALPFEGNIDWCRFGETFRALDYPGALLLEVEMRESAFKHPTAFLEEARRRGERLIELLRL